MTNVLKRNRRAMLCLVALAACCFAAACFTQPASVSGAVYSPPAYTAAQIPAEGDGVITFTGGAAYASVITAVYLKDVRDGGDYELLAPSEWSVSSNKLTVSYRQFMEELTNGADHDYTVKIAATGYEDLEVDLKVIARSAQNMIVRVFNSQADADAGTIAFQRVLTPAEIQALDQHQQNITMYCGMTGMGASKASGVYLRDLLDLAFDGTAYVFDSADIMKLRVTDYLQNEAGQKKVQDSFNLALGDLTALTQNAWFGMTSPVYETLFADRYYFPGMFAAYNQLVSEGAIAAPPASYAWPTLLTNPLTLEGAVPVEPMIALQFGQRILDRSMAGSEQFPHFGGSLAGLDAMSMNANDRYRLVMGQQLASDADGNVQLCPETTRFMITYNIFGIDIIKVDNLANQTPPDLRVNISGNGVKITYRDAMDYSAAILYQQDHGRPGERRAA